MSEIKSINFEDLVKIVRAGKITDLQSCEVMIDGGHHFTAIIFHGDKFASEYPRTQSEFLGVIANISGGKDPEEVLKEIQPLSLYDQQVSRMAKAREAKKAKQELVKV